MLKKFLTVLVLISLVITISPAKVQGDIYKVKKLKGEVKVRHGAKENWENLSLGDTLKPDDTILLWKNSYVEIEGDKVFFKSNGNAIVNISDLRRLTKEELLLQLAFEEMRNVPDIRKEEKKTKSTGIYGTDISKEETKLKPNENLTQFWINGVKALFENGFYETASLRAKNLMSKFDELKDNLELKLIIATSLEKLEIYGEAISEYKRIISTSKDGNLNSKIERKIQELRAKLETKH